MIAETLNTRCDGDEGVLRHDNVSVGSAEDRDRLAHLPCALGTLPLQGAGPLQLGGGIVVCETDLNILVLIYKASYQLAKATYQLAKG